MSFPYSRRNPVMTGSHSLLPLNSVCMDLPVVGIVDVVIGGYCLRPVVGISGGVYCGCHHRRLLFETILRPDYKDLNRAPNVAVSM